MPDIQSGELLPPTEDEARSESTRVMEAEARYFKAHKSVLDSAESLIKMLSYAQSRQLHKALGMSWDEYVAKYAPKIRQPEFLSPRRGLESLLYRQGSSQRHIADLLGLAVSTVNDDLKALPGVRSTEHLAPTTEGEHSLPAPTTKGRDGKQYPRTKPKHKPTEFAPGDFKAHSRAMTAERAVTERKQASKRPELSQSQRQCHRAFKAGITALEKLQADSAYMDAYGDTFAADLQSLHGKLSQWLLQRDTESRMHNEF